MIKRLVEHTLEETFKQHLFNQRMKRADIQEKMYHYYVNNEYEVKQYLYNVLMLIYEEEELREDIIPDTVNITKKIINQQCVVYSSPAKRTILINDNEDKKQTELYDKILPNRINSIDKTSHRYAKLFNVALTQISWDKEDEKIIYTVDPTWKIDVELEDGNINKIKKVKYNKYFGKELYTVVWTDSEHYKLDKNGVATPVGNNELMLNPYNTIPFAFVRLEDSEDFYGNGQNDVIQTNEIINVLFTDLLNVGAILGAWGTPLLINTNLNKQSEKDGNRSSIRMGRKHPIYIDDVPQNAVKPEASYISSNPMISEIKDLIDWRIKVIANIKGLDPNSFLADVKATSGYSKMMDMVRQLEMRKDDIEQLREYEHDRFNKTRIIYNYHNTTNKLNEKAELKIDFAEIELPSTRDEIWAERKELESRKMADVLDFIIEDNPDIKSREEAQKFLDERSTEKVNNKSLSFDDIVNSFTDEGEN